MDWSEDALRLRYEERRFGVIVSSIGAYGGVPTNSQESRKVDSRILEGRDI